MQTTNETNRPAPVDPDVGTAWLSSRGLKLPDNLLATCGSLRAQTLLALLIELQRLAGVGVPFRFSMAAVGPLVRFYRPRIKESLDGWTASGLLACVDKSPGKPWAYLFSADFEMPAPAPAAPVERPAPAPEVVHIMPFGKHCGQPVAAVPTDYLRWLLREGVKVSKGLREAIAAELRRRPDGQTPAPEEMPKLSIPADADVRTALAMLSNQLLATTAHAAAAGMAHALLVEHLHDLRGLLNGLAFRLERERQAAPRRRFDYAALLKAGEASG